MISGFQPRTNRGDGIVRLFSTVLSRAVPFGRYPIMTIAWPSWFRPDKIFTDSLYLFRNSYDTTLRRTNNHLIYTCLSTSNNAFPACSPAHTSAFTCQPTCLFRGRNTTQQKFDKGYTASQTWANKNERRATWLTIQQADVAPVSPVTSNT